MITTAKRKPFITFMFIASVWVLSVGIYARDKDFLSISWDGLFYGQELMHDVVSNGMNNLNFLNDMSIYL